MTDIVQILTDFFATWRRSSEIISITDNGDGTADIEVCDTLFVAPCQSIRIDGVNYEVTKVDGKVITVMFTVLPTGTEYQTQLIHFTAGTVYRFNQEDTQDDNLKEPLKAWLMEPTVEEEEPIDSIYEYTAKIRLFFIMETNLKDWIIEDIYTNISKPLIKLAREFKSIRGIDRKFGVGKIVDKGDTITHQDFQVYILGKEDLNEGELDMNYSGVEITPRLPVYVTCNKCKT